MFCTRYQRLKPAERERPVVLVEKDHPQRTWSVAFGTHEGHEVLVDLLGGAQQAPRQRDPIVVVVIIVVVLVVVVVGLEIVVEPTTAQDLLVRERVAEAVRAERVAVPVRERAVEGGRVVGGVGAVEVVVPAVVDVCHARQPPDGRPLVLVRARCRGTACRADVPGGGRWGRPTTSRSAVGAARLGHRGGLPDASAPITPGLTTLGDHFTGGRVGTVCTWISRVSAWIFLRIWTASRFGLVIVAGELAADLVLAFGGDQQDCSLHRGKTRLVCPRGSRGR